MTTVRPSRPHPPNLANPVLNPHTPLPRPQNHHLRLHLHLPSVPQRPPCAPRAAHRRYATARAARARRSAPSAARRAALGCVLCRNPDTPEPDEYADNLLDGLRVALERARTTASTRGRNLIRAFVGGVRGGEVARRIDGEGSRSSPRLRRGGYLGVIVVARGGARAVAGAGFRAGDASGEVRNHARVA